MRWALAFGMGLMAAAACSPIEPVPLSNAPVNRCACDGFGPEARCREGRCETATRPNYPFFVVAHVPSSSFYAPASTFVLYSNPPNGAPTFTRTAQADGTGTFSQCTGASCAKLGGMTLVTSSYRVSQQHSADLGYPLPEGQLIPVQVEFEVVGNLVNAAVSQPDFPAGLPTQPRFVAPQLIAEGAVASTALPSGRYRRIMYPQPPFDALFPPRTDEAILRPNSNLDDGFVLNADTIDDRKTRGITVARADGLDGFRVWVADARTKRRISTIKTLSGTSQTLTLDTTGERRSESGSGSLGDTVEAVVAPPPSYIGTPTYINPAVGGDLGNIRYPAIPAPQEVVGTVVEDAGIDEAGKTIFLAVPSRLSFESTSLETPREPGLKSPLLHYSTSVGTDDVGSFATVLPPGTYTVTIEPQGFTSFATSRQIVEVKSNVTRTTLLFKPPVRTIVRGRAVLADGRPLVEAVILATPRSPDPTQARPRPGQTRTDSQGRFGLELDQGPYVITAVPRPGTAFPRVSISSEILPVEAELPEIIIPAPYPLSFRLRDGTRSENGVANALVRVFAVPGVRQTEDFQSTTAEPIELGNGTSDASGQVEILLAPEAP